MEHISDIQMRGNNCGPDTELYVVISNNAAACICSQAEHDIYHHLPYRIMCAVFLNKKVAVFLD